MTIADDIETEARALGVCRWCVDEDGDPEPLLDLEVGDLLIRPEFDGRYTVQVWGPPPLLEARVDGVEALVLVRLAALPPRVRRCPDCRAVGAEWPLRFHQAWGEARDRDDYDKQAWQRHYARELEVWTLDVWLEIVYGPCPACSAPAEVECPGCGTLADGSAGRFYCRLCKGRGKVPATVECGACDGLKVDGEPERMECGGLTVRPCTACKGSGKVHAPPVPTGRVSTPWHEVMLGARPKPESRGVPMGLTPGEEDAWRLFARTSSGPDGSGVSDGWVHFGKRERRHLARIMEKHPECIERRRIQLYPYEYRMKQATGDPEPGDPQDIADLHALADELMSPAHDPLDEARRTHEESKARSDLGLAVAEALARHLAAA